MPRPILQRNKLRPFPGPFHGLTPPVSVAASLPAGSPTKVQTVSGVSATGVASAAITVTAGNTLVLRVGNASGSTNAFTVADNSGSNTWSAARATGFQSGVGFSRIEIWVLFSAAGGTYTITATSASTQAALEVEEWTPFGGTVDVGTGGGNASSTTVNIPTPVTTSATQVVFTATNFTNRTFIDNNVGAIWTPITAVIQSSTTVYGGSAGVTALGQYKNNLTLTSAIGSGWAAVSLPYTAAASAALAGTIPAISNLPTSTLTTSITAAGQIDALSNLPTATLNGISAALAGTIPTVSNLPTATIRGSSAAAAGTIPAISNLPTATLATSITMGGTVIGVSNLPTATVTTSIRMAGTIAGQSDLPAALLATAIRLAGQIDALSNLPGAVLTTSIRMTGTIAGVSATTGTLLGGAVAALAGQIDGLSNLTAVLTTSITLVGTVAGVSNLPAAPLTTVIQLGGTITGVSSLNTAVLNGIAAALQGQVAAVAATSTATLVTDIRMSGAIASVAGVVGNLTGGVISIPPAVITIPVDAGGAGPVAKRRQGHTPFDDYTLMMDDEAILELYLLLRTR